MITRKANEIKPFIVMEVLEKAAEMEKRGEHIIHLEVGEPDFDVPQSLGFNEVDHSRPRQSLAAVKTPVLAGVGVL